MSYSSVAPTHCSRSKVTFGTNNSRKNCAFEDFLQKFQDDPRGTILGPSSPAETLLTNIDRLLGTINSSDRQLNPEQEDILDDMPKLCLNKQLAKNCKSANANAKKKSALESFFHVLDNNKFANKMPTGHQKSKNSKNYPTYSKSYSCTPLTQSSADTRRSHSRSSNGYHPGMEELNLLLSKSTSLSDRYSVKNTPNPAVSPSFAHLPEIDTSPSKRISGKNSGSCNTFTQVHDAQKYNFPAEPVAFTVSYCSKGAGDSLVTILADRSMKASSLNMMKFDATDMETEKESEKIDSNSLCERNQSPKSNFESIMSEILSKQQSKDVYPAYQNNSKKTDGEDKSPETRKTSLPLETRYGVAISRRFEKFTIVEIFKSSQVPALELPHALENIFVIKQ